jgi:hypothetical protein
MFDSDKDDLLTQVDFVAGASRLFTTHFEDNVKLVFDLFDFDDDGFVTAEDLRVLLSHVPVTKVLGGHVITPKEGQLTRTGAGLYFSYGVFPLIDRCIWIEYRVRKSWQPTSKSS